MISKMGVEKKSKSFGYKLVGTRTVVFVKAFKTKTNQDARFPVYPSVPGPFSQILCMCPQDSFIQKAKKRVESIHESDLWVDGKFMTEKAMSDDGYEPFSGYRWLKPLL